MSEHPIQELLQTAMQNLDGIVDANATIGKPIETSEGTIIIPICKTSVGFLTGGSEIGAGPHLGGGVAGGVSVSPVAFVIISKSGVKTVSLELPQDIYSRILEATPQILEQIKSLFPGASSLEASASLGQTDPNITELQ